MEKNKGKQQKSILSFFSPPSAKKTSKANKDSSEKPKTKSPVAAKTNGQVKSSRKKIDFSPRPTKSKPAKVELTPPSSRNLTETKENVTPQLPTHSLATSSEEEEQEEEEEDEEKVERQEKKPTEQTPVTQEPKKRLRRAAHQNTANPKATQEEDKEKDEEEEEEEDADEDGDEPVGPRKKKTRRAVKIEESSEEEWNASDSESAAAAAEDESEATDEPTSESELSDELEATDEDEDEPVRPTKRRKRLINQSHTNGANKNKKTATVSPKRKYPVTSTPPRASSPSSSKKTRSSPQAGAPASGDTLPNTGANGVCGAGCHLHDALDWLHAKRRDLHGNRPDSPDFDPRTLYIPPDFLKKETPAMVQWWDVKSHNMDTVLFFKVGKFYELFHMDADIGFKELNLIYMKGDKAHSGFPEIAYSKMSSALVAKGYRVARVEQTETPEMMKERNSTCAKKSKVVRREICSVLSAGTNTISFLDAPCSGSQTADSARLLLAIKEDFCASDNSPSTSLVEYGVCVVDCSTSVFQIGQFRDTSQRDRLKTLLAQFHIVEIVNERNGLSHETKMVLKHGAPSALRSELRVGKEFWDASKTLEEMERAKYFDDEKENWPPQLLACLDASKEWIKPEAQLAISALGGCIWHLRRSMIDQELVSMRNFQKYVPADEAARQEAPETFHKGRELSQQYVVLDAQTINNLEILNNNYNGSRKGTLIEVMDKTVTHFGSRMFKEWVLKPLCHLHDIKTRLDAVEQLTRQPELMSEARDELRKIPDLERLLSRVHALGSVYRSKHHPDSRAVMYESSTYNLRKIRDFIALLRGFEASVQLSEKLAPQLKQLESPMLHCLLQIHSEEDDETYLNSSRVELEARGMFPRLQKRLAFFRKSFNQAEAQKTGVITPQPGIDPDFDEACESIQEIHEELEEYLNQQRTVLRCKQISYWGKKKEDRYQLEVPESVIQTKQPREYELKSRRKGFKRFHTPTIRDLLAQLAAAEERKEEALKDQMRRIFHKFDEDYAFWMKAVQCLAVLDCLLSLAIVSSQSEGFVRPEIVSAFQDKGEVQPFIDIEDGVHPCVASTFENNGEFIPNDARLGTKGRGRMVLLSGPNMGGKSTLLRQTCVLVLMAQIGCFVPASKCRFTPVDRIFTRIGASDRILAGQSTLFVELAETATILNHASQHSLVILDELGRGTSTFDGTAIAYAVIEHLLRDVKCRTMFATHYHSLVEEYLPEQDKVALGHMDCLVDPENDRKVTFLYKLVDGMCPKSYGINVAILANLPQQVIDRAAQKSAQFEKSLQDHSHLEHEAMQLEQRVTTLLEQEPLDLNALHQLWQQAKQLGGK